MENLLLLSVLVATVLVPSFTARIPRGRRALGWTLLLVVTFTLVYAVVVTRVYAPHFVPEPFYP